MLEAIAAMASRLEKLQRSTSDLRRSVKRLVQCWALTVEPWMLAFLTDLQVLCPSLDLTR